MNDYYNKRNDKNLLHKEAVYKNKIKDTYVNYQNHK